MKPTIVHLLGSKIRAGYFLGFYVALVPLDSHDKWDIPQKGRKSQLVS